MKVLPFPTAESSVTMAEFVQMWRDGSCQRARITEYYNRQRLELQMHEAFVQWKAYDDISVWLQT